MSRFIVVRLFGAVLVTVFVAACGGGGSGGPSQPLISADAPSGTTGVAYSAFAFTVMSGGTAPFTWSETGDLPPGLSLSSSGQLSGTPTRAGTFPISVIVTDSSNPPLMNSVPVNLKIADSPILISAAPAPPDGTAACPYAGFTFMASGGSPGYTWAVTAGSLPAGMALNPNGSLAGTPAAAGPFTFTVTATDSAQTPQEKSQPFKVSVNPPLDTPLGTPVTMLGNGAFWIPYRATSANSSCGPTGVFVIPSNALTTAPAYVTASANTMFLASGQNVTVNGTNVVTAYSPATLMFAATDTNNNIHVYGLNLVAAQTPTATQISSLSLPLTAGAALNSVICDSHGSSSNLLQPTTLFVVLHIAGTTGCNTKGDVWEVVHYTDSAAIAPTVVSITSTNIQELYAPSGALVGLLLLDAASSNLYVYSDDSFKVPATAIPGGGIAAVGTVYSNNNMTASGTAFTGTVLFLAVTTSGGTQYLYRLAYRSTAATNEYTAVGGLGNGVSDGTNLYFPDNSKPQLILQEPLAGGPPIKLYSYTVPGAGQPYSLVGCNGSLLVMSTYATPDGSGYLSRLATLPVGTLSANTTALGNSVAGFLGATMVETTPGTPSTALVFVNLEEPGSSSPAVPPSYSSEVLTPSDTAQPAGGRHSVFITGTNGLSGYVLLVGNLQYGQLGLFTLSAINLETLASTTFQIPPGPTFTGPVAARPQLTGLSNLIGAGAFADQGLAYDLSKNLLVPIVIANSTVAPF
jgi:hypothetical protein